MSRILDIDMYRDGFDVKSVDCFHNPIAAAAGYFNRDYYFYYAFLNCLMGNTVNKERHYSIEYTTELLKPLNLCWNVFDFGDDLNNLVKIISDEIQKGHPVIVCVKYNSLFYNSYYKNMKFNLIHSIAVNGYNEFNNTFTIKEMTLLRDSFVGYENTDMHFSLQISAEMLKQIITDSNLQFKDEGLYFANKIFSISLGSIGNEMSTTKIIIEHAVTSLQNWKCEFGNIINKYNDDSFMDDINYYMLKFIGCLKPIFRFLSMHAADSCETKHILECEKEVETIKRNIMSVLVKHQIKKDEIQPLHLKYLFDEWQEADRRIANLIIELSKIDKKLNYEHNYINLFTFYNNMAFEQQILDQSIADITGEGTHFLFDVNIIANDPWQNGEYCFVYSYTPGKYDNVSCKGQVIDLPDHNLACCLSILGCSEYGSFCEEIIVEYSDGSKYSFIAAFSDFFQSAVFREKLYWSGTALNRKDEKTVQHSFNARLFAKRYKIKLGNVSRIILPVCKNIHIFAITTETEVK